MAFIDLGAPAGYAVSGYGSENIAQEIGGVDAGVSTAAYENWVRSTRLGQVAPECGARLLPQTVDVPHVDDYGQLVASHPGSGSI